MQSKSALLEKYKRIENVDLSTRGQTLTVSIKEREPAYLWCEGNLSVDADTEHAQKCYFADKTGYIFANAPQFSGDAFFIYAGLIEEDPIW